MITPRAIKQYTFLLVFALLILLLLFGLNKISPSFFPINNILLLTGGFAFIAITALVIFFLGTEGKGEKRVFATLIAIGVKMLLSFVLALLFIVVFKNKDTGSVILFFILYLVFTVYIFLTFFRIAKRTSG
jgi:O-antigen/teichoic acid export membrane protein